MTHGIDPSANAGNRTGLKAAALLAAALALAACTHGSGKTSAEKTTVPSIEQKVNSGQNTIERAQKSKEINAKVNELVTTQLKDLPERVKAYANSHNLMFESYPYSDRPGAKRAVLSQSPNTLSSPATLKGSAAVGYSFFVIYEDMPDGTRTFSSIEVLSADNTNPDTMNDPKINGYGVLQGYSLSKAEDGTWKATYFNPRKQGEPSPNPYQFTSDMADIDNFDLTGLITTVNHFDQDVLANKS